MIQIAGVVKADKLLADRSQLTLHAGITGIEYGSQYPLDFGPRQNCSVVDSELGCVNFAASYSFVLLEKQVAPELHLVLVIRFGRLRQLLSVVVAEILGGLCFDPFYYG